MGSPSGMSSDRVFLLLGPITCFPRQGSVPLEQGDSTGTRLCCPHTKGEGSQPSLSPSRALASPLTIFLLGQSAYVQSLLCEIRSGLCIISAVTPVSPC